MIRNVGVQKERSIFEGLCRLFVSAFVPCITHCLSAIYGRGLFSAGDPMVCYLYHYFPLLRYDSFLCYIHIF